MIVPVMPSGVVTTTSWEVPGAKAGIVASSVWSSVKVTPIGVPPTVRVVGSVKLVPEIVTAVPPAAGPEGGSIEKAIRCENSEVLPSGSVAVAEILSPSWIVAVSVTSIVALPLAVPAGIH